MVLSSEPVSFAFVPFLIALGAKTLSVELPVNAAPRVSTDYVKQINSIVIVRYLTIDVQNWWIPISNNKSDEHN